MTGLRGLDGPESSVVSRDGGVASAEIRSCCASNPVPLPAAYSTTLTFPAWSV